MLNGTLSPSCPILMVLPASAGYLAAILAGSQVASSALAGPSAPKKTPANKAIRARNNGNDV